MSEKLTQSEDQRTRIYSYPSPEEIVQSVLMEGLVDQSKVSAPVRRKAQKITNALRNAGWRIIR